jgi:Kef-type K+ transport system membrane component KefB
MTDYELSRLLISLMLLLSSALILGQFFEFLRMPRVIGEISAGLLLGPSFFGEIAPNMQQSIFNAFEYQDKLLSVFYWLGLILLMFSAGFNISSAFDKKDRLLIMKLIIGGIGLPFLFGFFTAAYIPNNVVPNELSFSLVIATAAAVTSIPVLTKIFLDLGIAPSRFARMVLGAAALQDLILWSILAVAIAAQQGEIVNTVDLVVVLGTTVAFAVFVILLAPTVVRALGKFVITRFSNDSLLGYTLLFCVALVSFASFLKVNIIFGALLAGLVVGRFANYKMDTIKKSISSIAIWFFVPIYFALVGFKLNLIAHLDPILLIVFFIGSSIIKITSVSLLSKSSCKSWLHSVDFGIVMNARGGPGIVLASLAYSANIIDENLLVVLVLTAILTSLFAGLWLRNRIQKDGNLFT